MKFAPPLVLLLLSFEAPIARAQNASGTSGPITSGPITPGAAAPGASAASGAPSATEQDEILERMHAYADQYVSKLPNFICEQVTRQFEAGAGSDKWHKGDVLTAKLSYNNGNEQRQLSLVNGKDAEKGRRHPRTPLTTEGEFGKLLSQVLGKDGQAIFTWSRWETLRGKKLAVFDYSVDRIHSTLSLRIGGGKEAIIPYTGSVYGDPVTGGVWQISDTSSEIPPEIQTRKITTVVDYGEVQIGGATYLLPVQAEVTVLAYIDKIRNQITFENYRKFEAKTVITFGDTEPTNPTPQQ